MDPRRTNSKSACFDSAIPFAVFVMCMHDALDSMLHLLESAASTRRSFATLRSAELEKVARECFSAPFRIVHWPNLVTWRKLATYARMR